MTKGIQRIPQRTLTEREGSVHLTSLY